MCLFVVFSLKFSFLNCYFSSSLTFFMWPVTRTHGTRMARSIVYICGADVGTMGVDVGGVDVGVDGDSV